MKLLFFPLPFLHTKNRNVQPVIVSAVVAEVATDVVTTEDATDVAITPTPEAEATEDDKEEIKETNKEAEDKDVVTTSEVKLNLYIRRNLDRPAISATATAATES